MHNKTLFHVGHKIFELVKCQAFYSVTLVIFVSLNSYQNF